MHDCICSCFYQNYRNIELIAIDDYSQDNTAKLLKQYKSNNIRVFLNKKNKGGPFCFNQAIKKSKGDFIVINGSDDYYTPNSIVDRLGAFRQNPDVDLVCGKIKSFYGTHNYAWCLKNDARLKSHTNRIVGHGVMFRRSVFERYGLFFDRLRLNEDQEMWYRLGLTGERKTGIKTAYINAVCAYVRIHKQSTVTRMDEKRKRHQRELKIKRILQLMKEGVTKKNTVFL